MTAGSRRISVSYTHLDVYKRQQPNITIPNQRNNITIDVSAYKGNNVKFAFYASDGTVFVSQANYRIYVDNFKVQKKNTMGVTESKLPTVNVYPNPTTDKIVIQSRKKYNRQSFTI